MTPPSRPCQRPSVFPWLHVAQVLFAIALAWLALDCQTASAQLAPNLGVATSAGGTAGSCDPTVQSCAPPTCTPAQQLLGLCHAGDPAPGDGETGGTCTPDPGGDPGCTGGPGPSTTSGGAGGDVQVGGGNPINLASGNKYQRETDLAPLPGLLGLELTRHYNSLSAHAGLMGAGWHMSYETVLYDQGGQIQVVQADGQRLMFQRGAGRELVLCTTPRPQDGLVTITTDAGGRSTYVWRWPDGRRLTFGGGSGGGHPLQTITAPDGEQLTITYSPSGDLVQVRDPQGRKLDFIYGGRNRRLQAVDTPLGRVHYTIDEQGRLTQASWRTAGAREPATTRIYHYESRWNGGHPYALTGITLRAVDPVTQGGVERRLSTYAYNREGLAILTTKGDPRRLENGKPVAGTGVDQLDVEYVTRPLPSEGRPERDGQARPLQWGKTVITNSEGGRSELLVALIGGHYRLLQMTGAGCSACGPANMRYAYDRAGQVLRATRLDDQGRPLQSQVTEYDAHGRLAREGVQAGAGASAPATQWLRRYEYADMRYRDGTIALAARPSLIAQPSVVPGREHVWRFAYHPDGQLARVTEAGFSPVDAQGRLTPDGTGFERTTEYRYRAVGSRNLLAEIDGPVAAGEPMHAVGTHVTRFEWNDLGGRVVRIDRPGGQRVDIAADASGRWTRLLVSDGVRRAQLEARYDDVANAAPLPSAFAGSAWFVDAAGNAVDGTRRSGQLVLGRDVTGALETLQLAGVQYDADFVRQARTSLQAPAASSGDDRPAAPHDRDAWQRPVAWRDAQGATLLRAAWGEPGSASASVMLGLEAAGAQAWRLVDDAGRVVAIRNPGQGWQSARYDAADRLLEVRDPRGARQVGQRDAAGRLVKVERFAPGAANPEQTLTWTYVGEWAAEETLSDADGVRTNITERAADGQVQLERLRVRPAGDWAADVAPYEMSVRYRYDPQGRLIERRFTDAAGRQLALGQRLDAQGQPANVSTAGWLPGWLGGGREIVRRIEWQHVLAVDWARTIEHGDGSVDRYDALTTAPAALPVARAMPAVEGGGDGMPPSWSTPGEFADAAGLPALIDTAQGPQRLRWNAAGQLQQTTRADGGASRYIYDARGRRIAKRVIDRAGRAQTTLAFHEQGRLLAEADARGRATWAWAWMGWRAVARLDLQPQGWWPTLRARLFGPDAAALHTSRSGQVLSMTEHGQQTWQQAPLATGLVNASLEAANPAHQPLRYAGQYHDDDSGLDYHGARYFEPRTGRFISPDPAGVADAVSEAAPGHLLDLYAYAGGNPDEFFDPDGAARIRYFAITTGATGAALGTTQGYSQARWAFIIDDVKAPTTGSGDATLDTLQTKYAANATGLLYDAGGNFLSGANTASWNGGATAAVPTNFSTHYGDNLISIPQFTLAMSDADATRLIASFITADAHQLYGASGTCPMRSALLPPIKFASDEPDIVVTSASSGIADKQRILACGAGSDTNIDQRRIAKYEAASEINETAQINRDCSRDGCPGIGYYCDATKCYPPVDQLRYGRPHTTSEVYTPSYGRSQFIGMTLVGLLISNYSSFSAADRAQLGLTPAMLTLLNKAKTRGQKMTTTWGATATPATYADANAAWSHLTPVQQAKFTADTGLGETEYTDMMRMKKSPPTNSAGVSLANDAKQGFVTRAIMSDPAVETFLMGLFQGFAKFTTLSHALMNVNLTKATAYQPSASEQYLAAMVARLHNGGDWRRTYAQLTNPATDAYNYVENFIGTAGHTNKGDWDSIRCTNSFGARSIDDAGVGIGGLQFKPVNLH